MPSIGRLKICKAWFCASRYDADKNADGTLKIQLGWVVTGFLDSNTDWHYIPETYAGLPIIGILHTAYEQLDEYKDDDAYHKIGDDKIDLPVQIDFSYRFMLFVFAPRRFLDRYHVLPTYIVNSSKNNCANMYGAAYFSYAHGSTANNLVIQIMNIKKVPYYFGYTHLGRCEEIWDTYRNGVRSKDSEVITLRQASAKTFDTCYKPITNAKLLDYIPDKHTELYRASWKALQVGKYYSLGFAGATLKDIKADFDSRNSVLGFVWQPVDKDIACAFNLISGTEVIFRPVL